MRRTFSVALVLGILGVLLAAYPTTAEAAQSPSIIPLSFRVTFAEGMQTTPFTGRIYVVVTDTRQREPRRRLNNWLEPHYLFAVDVKDHDPSQPVLIDKNAQWFPVPLAELERTRYQCQAIARRNLDSPTPGQGEGDLHSITLVKDIDPATSGMISLELGQIVGPTVFTETDRVKQHEMVSPLMSRFLGRERVLRAGVILPDGWKADGKDRYPVLWLIPMHRSDDRFALVWAEQLAKESAANKMLIVVPDTSCINGHSLLVDSDNNGPWATAMMTELIPAIESKYRGDTTGDHRYLFGISAGGFGALWMQITYPEAFNGCWAHAPDPVDFSAYLNTDIYARGTNLFTDEAGAQRPIFRVGNNAMFVDGAARYELVMGPGGRLSSQEAAFGPKGKDGLPRPLFDRLSGNVYPDVAKAWRRYDIRMTLERQWARLGPKLAGKIHLYVGSLDNFLLTAPVEKLKAAMAGLQADIDIQILEGKGHDIATDALEPMYRLITDNYAASAGDKSPIDR